MSRGALLGLRADGQPLNNVASRNGGYYLTDCHIMHGKDPAHDTMWVKFQNGRTGLFSSAQSGGKLLWASPAGPHHEIGLSNGYTAREYSNGLITTVAPDGREMSLAHYSRHAGPHAADMIKRTFARMSSPGAHGPVAGPTSGGRARQSNASSPTVPTHPVDRPWTPPPGDVKGTPLYNDAVKFGGYMSGDRHTIAGVGTYVKFRHGQSGCYDVNGKPLLPSEFGRRENAKFMADSKRLPNPSPTRAAMTSVMTLGGVPKSWAEIGQNIAEGAQDTSDWLQYGFEPDFYLHPSDADRKRWDQKWLKGQVDPQLASFGNKVAADVPSLVAGPGEMVAYASQYDQNQRDATAHEIQARLAKNPRDAAQHRAAAAQCRAQNRQIVDAAKESVGLGPRGILTRGTRAAGYAWEGQRGMARRELSQAYLDTLNYSHDHPLLFVANLAAVADGGFRLTGVGLKAVEAVGATGMDRLAARALAEADEVGIPASKRAQLYDVASKCQQISYQLRQGKPIGAIRVWRGGQVEPDGLNTEHMPQLGRQTPRIATNGASADAGALSVSGQPSVRVSGVKPTVPIRPKVGLSAPVEPIPRQVPAASVQGLSSRYPNGPVLPSSGVKTVDPLTAAGVPSYWSPGIWDQFYKNLISKADLGGSDASGTGAT